jgi:hypothetical protein
MTSTLERRLDPLSPVTSAFINESNQEVIKIQGSKLKQSFCVKCIVDCKHSLFPFQIHCCPVGSVA